MLPTCHTDAGSGPRLYWPIYVPFFRQSTVRGCAFPVAEAKVWNSLPSDVTSALSLPVFRNRLKHTYFAAVVILSDHNLYPHWFGYYFPLHSGPCDSFNCLGHFKNVSWLTDWPVSCAKVAKMIEMSFGEARIKPNVMRHSYIVIKRIKGTFIYIV